MSATLDNLQVAARMMRESVKDKSYRAYPIGMRAGEYLRYKRGRLTRDSYESYESCLQKLAEDHLDLEIEDFEPPVGTQRLEEFLDRRWGDMAPQTYNKNHAVLKDFFVFLVLKGYLHGNPMLPIPTHKKRDVHRETFNDDTISRVLADGPHPDHVRRDRVALHLLLDYGLRKGALLRVQYKHFNLHRKTLTVFTKGEKVRDLPLDDQLADEVAKLALELNVEPGHYLIPKRKVVFWKYDENGEKLFREFETHDQPRGKNGIHAWWYDCLQRAGVTAVGQRSGERMHKARHTAGQRVIDRTGGNLKAAQKLLGHSSIATTADIYVDWDLEQLRDTMREVLGD